MTIREHFRRAWYRILGGVIAPTLVLIFILVHYRYFGINEYVLTVFIAAIVIGAISLLTRNRFLCPRCGADAQQALRTLPRKDAVINRGMAWDRFDKCHQCGLSFDEPWPETPFKK